MKTVEQKAKAYDKALERAREWSETKNGYYTPKELCEEIFPELKEESEDEKLRKQLLNWFKDCHWDSIDDGALKRNDIIAWLEKQRDKIEPKFKNGQWIVFNGLTLYVNEVVQGYYRTTSIGGIPNSYDWNIDNAARLWTIQDAKDGDVLVNGDEIVIFKKSTFNEKDLSGCMFVHCKLRDKNGYWYTIGGINPTNYTPATKEQRDTLFQKMKEAGYEWNADKKELKKVKKTPQKFIVGDTIKYNGTEYKITEITPNGYKVYAPIYDEDAASLISFSAPAILVEQNSAWSQEDKKMSRFIGNAITDDGASEYLKSKGIEVIDAHVWLDELKERVQPKQEWSEEDEKNSYHLKILLENLTKDNKYEFRIISDNDRDKYTTWLESIKERYTWKPSDEQMKALWEVYKGGEEQAALATLYTDLKKLRKE